MELHHKPYKVALVALDLTAMDDHLIRYTAMISKLFPLERIFFVHVAKSLELPPDLLKKFPDLMAPLDESLEIDMRKKVEQHFVSSDIEVDYVIKEGNPIDAILKLARVKHTDLILMGRKQNLRGSGIVSSHIARKSPCSLLLVTENFKPEIGKVLVPLDFSRHAMLAMKQAQDLSESSGAAILLSHVYSVPTGFYKTGKTYDQFAEIMKKHAEKDCKVFLQKHKLNSEVHCEYLLTDDGRHAELIYSYGKKAGADLIILGSRGRTSASAFLIGSLAEKLALRDRDIPILIVKNKGENMSFLDSLMRV